MFDSLWPLVHQTSLCFTMSQSLLKLMSIESAMLSNHLILSPASLPALNLSQPQGLFQWVRSLHPVAMVLSFIFGISPSNEYSRLISFRINCFNLPEVQWTLKSLHLITGALKWGSVTSLNLFFFFQICYGYSSSFFYKFYNQLVHIYKTFCWDFDWECLKSIEQFEGKLTS